MSDFEIKKIVLGGQRDVELLRVHHIGFSTTVVTLKIYPDRNPKPKKGKKK